MIQCKLVTYGSEGPKMTTEGAFEFSRKGIHNPDKEQGRLEQTQ
jgi:hypothetical protein